MKYFQIFFTLYLLMTGLSPSFAQTLIATASPSTQSPDDSTTVAPSPTATSTAQATLIIVNPTSTTAPTNAPTVASTATSTPTSTATATSTPTPTPTVATTLAPIGLINIIAPYGTLDPSFTVDHFGYGYTPSSMYQYLNQRFQLKVDSSTSLLQYASCYQEQCSADNYDVYTTVCSNDCVPALPYTIIVNTDAKYISIKVNTRDGLREYTISIGAAATSSPSNDPTATPSPTPTSSDMTATQDPTASPTPSSSSSSSSPSLQPLPNAETTVPTLVSMYSNYGQINPSFSGSRYSYLSTVYGSEYITPTTAAPTQGPSPTATTEPYTPTNTVEPTDFVKPTSSATQPWLSSLYSTYGNIWPQFSRAVRTYYFTPSNVYDNIVLRLASSANTQSFQIAQCIRPATPTPTSTFAPTATETSTLSPSDEPTATPTPTSTPTPTATGTTSFSCLESALQYQPLCSSSSCKPNTVYDYSFNPKNVVYLSVKPQGGLLGAPQLPPYRIYMNDYVAPTSTPTPSDAPTTTVAPTSTEAPTGSTTDFPSSGEWKYIGCYQDYENARIMNQKLNSDALQTNTLCLQRALNLGFTYAATQYGQDCWASTTFIPGQLSTQCNMECSGFTQQVCGGFYASRVYKWLPTGATLNPDEFPGAATPSPTPSSTPTPTPTSTSTATATATPTATSTPTSTAAPTSTETPTSTAVPSSSISPSSPTQVVSDPTYALPSAISATDASATMAPTTTEAPTTVAPTTMAPTITVAPTTSSSSAERVLPYRLFLTPSSSTRTLRVRQCAGDSCSLWTSKAKDVCTYCDQSMYTVLVPLYQSSTFVEIQLFSSDIGNTAEQSYDGIITTYVLLIQVRASETYQQGYWKYVGCFQNSLSSPILPFFLNNDMLQTNSKCQSVANYNGFRFAGTTVDNNRYSCYASNAFDPTAYTISESCNAQCIGNVPITPTPSSTVAPTTTTVPSATVVVTPTEASSDNSTPTATVVVPTFQPSATPTATATATATPTWPIQQTCGGSNTMSVYEFINPATTTRPPTVAPTSTSAPTVAATATPTATSTVTSSPSPSATSSSSPTVIVIVPTGETTATPSSSTTSEPTVTSTEAPTSTASTSPTVVIVPTDETTSTPTSTSTSTPSTAPTATTQPATSTVGPSSSSSSSSTASPTLSQGSASPADPNAAALFSLSFSAPTITQAQLTQIQQLIATAGGIPASDVNRVVVSSPQLSQSTHGRLQSLLHARLLAASTVNVKILPSSTGAAPTVINVLLSLLSSWATPTSAIRTSPLLTQLGFDTSSDDINLSYVCANGVDSTPCGPYTNTAPTPAGSNLLTTNDATTSSSSSSSSSMSTGAIVGTVFGVIIGVVMFGLLIAYCMKLQEQRKSDSRNSFSV